jgi:selenocysteine lyase/cysteine desulfurase
MTTLPLVGDDVLVPLVTGGICRYRNFDYAASTPCLLSVHQTVEKLLPWYSSVHRGAGWKSQVTTKAYEDARETVRSFVNARPDDCVLFTRNTTDSINLLISMLPQDAVVVTWASGHHAALLPPRRRYVITLPIPTNSDEALSRLEIAFQGIYPQASLVVVTGASNVTGEIWPYHKITELAHQYGARVLLDAAQLAPHQLIDLTASDVDYIAFSGHKLYAPYGAGVLVGRCHWLEEGEPFLAGGGAVDFVRVEDVLWSELPDRQEAGSPNVLGAVALAQACRTLMSVDLQKIATREAMLIDVLRTGLAAIPGIKFYRMWPTDHPQVGILTFNLYNVPYAKLAAILSAEYGIGVRHGCFCAHPLMMHLLDMSDDEALAIATDRRLGRATQVPGAVRASVGVGTTVEDVLALVTAVEEIAVGYRRWDYQSTLDGTDCVPVPDPREYPV